jgi:hypothetical protein
VASRLSCRTVSLRNPPFRHPKSRSTRLRALRSAFRRRNARFPPRVPFPRRGFFGMPARIPRRRNPSRIAFASSAASAYTTFGRVRARPLPLFFTRRPPITSTGRRRLEMSSLYNPRSVNPLTLSTPSNGKVGTMKGRVRCGRGCAIRGRCRYGPVTCRTNRSESESL